MLNKIKTFFDSITFSKNDLRGSVVLVIILGVVLVVPPIYRTITPIEDELAARDAAILDSLVRELTIQQKTQGDSIITIDPNQLTFDDWVGLGASDFEANSLLKYKKRNGDFKCLEEILEVNGIKESHVSSYFQYFGLPEKCRSRKGSNGIKFELNTVSKAELEQLGINTKMVNRILKYRKLLGGFYSKKQLEEVYEISQSDLEKVKRSGSLDPSKVKKIEINEVSYFNLRKHPYVSGKLASKITNYRKKKKGYKSLIELKEVHGMTEEVYNKLVPYLNI